MTDHALETRMLEDMLNSLTMAAVYMEEILAHVPDGRAKWPLVEMLDTINEEVDMYTDRIL